MSERTEMKSKTVDTEKEAVELFGKASGLARFVRDGGTVVLVDKDEDETPKESRAERAIAEIREIFGFHKDEDPLEMSEWLKEKFQRNKTTKPAWTTTPPTEPGWYWSESEGIWYRAPRRIIEDDGELYQLHGGNDPRRVASMVNRGWRWWPVPIEEPGR